MSPTTFKDLGANATARVKSGGAVVYSLTCHNENASERYVQLHNTTSAPSSGTSVPAFSFLVPALAQVVIGTDFFTNGGCAVGQSDSGGPVGLYFAFSTTKDVYTAATATDQFTWINFS